MSERTHAPRSGGRAAEPQRPANGRREAGMSRDADATGSAARGARHFPSDRSSARAADTRRSGIGGAGEPAPRGSGRGAQVPRGEGRDRGEGREARAGVRGDDRVRGETRDRGRQRDDEPGRGRVRDTGGVRGETRGRDSVRGRTSDGVRGESRGRDGDVRAEGRSARADRVAAAERRPAGKAGADKAGAKLAGGKAGGRFGAAMLGGGKPSGGKVGAGKPGAPRRSDVDAPVDGTAALQLEVTAEPLRSGEGANAPRLAVAPPPPIHRGPRAPFVASVIGVVIVGVLGILLINTKTAENSFRITDLEKQNTALDNQQQDLDNQLVQASSVGNLDAAARRLGMVKVDLSKLALIRLPDGKVIGVPTPADGEPSVTKGDDKSPLSGTTDLGAENIKPADGGNGSTAHPTNGQPANGQPANGQPANGQPANGQPANGQPANGQPANGQPANGQPVNGQIGNGQPVNGQVGNGQPVNGQAVGGQPVGVPPAGTGR